MTFGEVLEDAGGGDVVLLGDRECGRAGQDVFQAVKSSFFRGSAEDGVLDDGVFDACFTEFATKVGVVRDVDALVFDENAGDGVFQFACKFRDLSFLHFEYFFACHLRFTSWG